MIQIFLVLMLGMDDWADEAECVIKVNLSINILLYGNIEKIIFSLGRQTATMEQELSAQIMQWHENDEHQQIVDTLLKIPPADRDYDMIGSIGRAYNNLSMYGRALEQFAFIAEQGKKDPLWYFRVGYSYYYMERYEEAAGVLSTALELDPGDQDAARLLDWSHSKWQQQLKAESESDEGEGGGDANFNYLQDMYKDSYYPTFLVDKVKEQILEVVRFLESGSYSNEAIQDELDKMTIAINNLQEEFDEHDSEIETVARDSIGTTVATILHAFKVDIDIETAIRERDW